MNVDPVERLIRGAFAPVAIAPLVALPDAAALGRQLRALPPTFTHVQMPTVWGKAFENHRTFADYLRPDADTPAMAARFAPFTAAVHARFDARGYTVEPLRTADGRPFATGDVRLADVPRGSTSLHVDDLARDGAWMPDFVLPPTLAEEPWVQLSVLQWLEGAGHGVLRVYGHRHTPADDAHQLDNGWQFADAAVEGAPFVDLRPVAGTTLVMNNHHLHDVRGGDHDDAWLYFSVYALVQPKRRRVFLYV